MADEDKPETPDHKAKSAEAGGKQPQSMQGPSEEQPSEAQYDATAPNPALEPTEQDEPEEAERHEKTVEDADQGHGKIEDHGLAHTMPIWMLVGVLVGLMVLTILTVSVTSFDLGSQGNLVVAMVIATVKACLVVTFFMHVLWDKKFHLILLLTAVLFVVLFLSMSVADRGEYQHNIDLYTNVTATAPVK